MTEEKKLTGCPSIDKPWLKYYSGETINAPLPECTVYEYLYKNNKDYPSDIAINYLGRKISYRELFENIDKTAAAFLKAGVKAKEVVTVALPSIPEALYCVYALNRIGAVANMIHPLAGKEETLFYFNEVQSRIAVIFSEAYAVIADDIGKSSVKKVIVVSPADSLPIPLKLAYRLKADVLHLDGRVFQSWKAFIREGGDTAVNAVKRKGNELAIISHTGGTTGEPKGVMCTDRNINAMIVQISHVLSVTRQGRQLAVLPPFVNYSLVNAMLEPLALGNTTILIPNYKSSKLFDYIKKYRPNYISSIPLYWEALLDDNKSDHSIDFSFLKYPIYGGEAMDLRKEEAVNRLLHYYRVPNVLAKGLGMTELVSAATLTPSGHNIINSVGVPLPKMSCKITEIHTTRELSYHQEGEICFSGPTVMLGYYGNQQATDEIVKIHTDGQRWLHTGDLGYLDENGVLYVTGRIKRIIMTKGEDQQVTKMFPDRIEKVLYTHPAVELCCVVGVSDPVRINYPKAYIVLKAGKDKNTVKNEILEVCRKSLPGYMIPEAIEFLADLPRTTRGKIDYRAMEEKERYKT